MATKKTTGSKTTKAAAKAPTRAPAKAPAKATAAKPRATKAAATSAPRRKPAAKATPTTAVKSAPVKGVTLEQSPDTGNVLTKKELFERIKITSGVKGQEVRKVMDAVLNEIGAALVRGDSLKLQPLGTMKVQRQKTASNADMVVCKLRRKKPETGGTDPLAAAAE